MSLSSSFQVLSFQRKVQDALQTVERTLELERKPRLAADVDHTYGAKYGLVNLTSNAAIIAYMNCFNKLGLDADVLKCIDKTKPATLRFDSATSWNFLKKATVDVPTEKSYEMKEETKGITQKLLGSSTKTFKTVQHVTEFHWEVEFNWSISVYSGTSVGDKKVIKSRKIKTIIITPSKEELQHFSSPPIDLSLTWLLKQIDAAELSSQFKVDTEDADTKTPRRNKDVQEAVNFALKLQRWCQSIERSFIRGQIHHILQTHNPALSKPLTHTSDKLLDVKNEHLIFNPILPLMEDSAPTQGHDDSTNSVESKSIIGLQSSNINDDDHKALLAPTDISKLLNEHVRTLEDAISEIEKSWPSGSGDEILSSSEATLSLLNNHLIHLCIQYTESMSYIEKMMENQLIAAIGKRLTPHDLDKFVKFHNAKLLCPKPQPFSHAIRRPAHYPVGLLSIESHDGENGCIQSHSREVSPTSSLKIPLSAATILELTGQQHLHGYMNHRFGSSNKRHQLIARARQFSSFILVIGNMTNGSTLDPKDAIIVQNKDELLIPLLLEELPTAKEFKDAVKSLSPEQQRFANAYRKMQLASSVFGVCVIQIKPQLETLLRLPADALDKEMKLTQDLMELFVEYQVPSDLLSYNGFSEDVSAEDKISNVRDNVKGVMDVVNAEKEKQLKMEQSKTEMAMEKTFQRAAREMSCEDASGSVFSSASPGLMFGSADPPERHCPAILARSAPRMMMKSSRRSAAPTVGAYRAPPCAPVMAMDDMASFNAELMELQPSSVGSVVSSNTRRGLPKPESQQQNDAKGKKPKTFGADEDLTMQPSELAVDFTIIPQLLDSAVEKSGEGSALRSTTIKTGDRWVRNRQENLLTGPQQQNLNAEEIKREKNKAFDLLDALSRSGSLPIAYSELHVVIAVTHCFDKDVMSTVVCDNINPIEKLELSTLLLASSVHGVAARELVGDANELERLEAALPLLLQPAENDE